MRRWELIACKERLDILGPRDLPGERSGFPTQDMGNKSIACFSDWTRRPQKPCYSLVGIFPTEVLMPTIQKVSIALPAEMVSIVREAVERGEYSSSSEVVREALRDWSHKRDLREKGLEELRSVWKQALEDQSPGVSPHDIFERLERKYQAIAEDVGEKKECA